MSGERVRQELRTPFSNLRSHLTWHRLPSWLWLLVLVFSAAVLVTAVVLLPSEVQRGRAVQDERICGTDPEPCLDRLDGILTLVDDVEYEPLAKNQPEDGWTLTLADGHVVEFWMSAESQDEVTAGAPGTLLLWSGGIHRDSVEMLRQDDQLWRLTEAGWASISFCVAAVLAGIRTLLVVPRRLRRRLAQLRAVEGSGRAWWGTAPLPEGLRPLDPDFLVWWGLVPVALLATSLWPAWIFWAAAPTGLVLLHLVRTAIARDRAAGWVDPFEAST